MPEVAGFLRIAFGLYAVPLALAIVLIPIGERRHWVGPQIIAVGAALCSAVVIAVLLGVFEPAGLPQTSRDAAAPWVALVLGLALPLIAVTRVLASASARPPWRRAGLGMVVGVVLSPVAFIVFLAITCTVRTYCL
jgi:hypothetical protein